MTNIGILATLDAGDYQCVGGSNPEVLIATFEKKGFTGNGRTDRSPLKIRLPFDWNGTDPTDRNWMFQLHAWRMLDPYLHLMVKDGGERRSFKRCVMVIRDWTRDNILGKAGPFTWYDMSTGIRASKLALMARAGPAYCLNLTEIEGFDKMLTQHFAELTNPKKLSSGNHGLFQMQGLKSLAAAFPSHPKSKDAAVYAIRKMIDLIKSQMGEYGIHTEHSPDYHFMASRRINIILNSPDWQIPEMDFARSLMMKSEKAKPWLLDAKSRTPPLGDSNQTVIKAARPPLYEWPHKEGKNSLGAILDGYALVRSSPEIPIKKSSYLFLTATYHSRSHKHDDCLSLIWHEGGEEILIDPGKYAYQKDEFRSYFVSRRAHNTLEFDGKGGVESTSRPYGSGMRDVVPLSHNAWLIEAEAPCSPTGEVHRRRVLFQPGRRLIVFDRVIPQDDQEHRYTLWWHFPQSAQIEFEQDTCIVKGLAENRVLRMQYVSTAGKMVPKTYKGEVEPRVQGWISPSYLERVPAPVLGVTASSSGLFEAVTIFDWTGKGFPDQSSEDLSVLSAEELHLIDVACQ